MLYADLVIVPTTPSQLDFDVLNTMFERIKEVKEFNESLKVAIVMNKLNPNPLLTKEINDFYNAINTIKEDSGFKLCENLICDRIAYKRAISDGLGITEYTDQKAINEFNNLFNEFMEITEINKKMA